MNRLRCDATLRYLLSFSAARTVDVPITSSSDMCGLLMYRRAERLYGKSRYLVISLLAGLASSVGAMITFLLFPGTPFAVGASGAFYAIVTAETMTMVMTSRRSWLMALLL